MNSLAIELFYVYSVWFFLENHNVQKENESGAELFEMENPDLKEDDEKEKSFVSYSKEEIDAKFSELLSKIENIGKVEEKGEE